MKQHPVLHWNCLESNDSDTNLSQIYTQTFPDTVKTNMQWGMLQSRPQCQQKQLNQSKVILQAMAWKRNHPSKACQVYSYLWKPNIDIDKFNFHSQTSQLIDADTEWQCLSRACSYRWGTGSEGFHVKPPGKNLPLPLPSAFCCLLFCNHLIPLQFLLEFLI